MGSNYFDDWQSPKKHGEETQNYKNNIMSSVSSFLRAEFINRLDEILFFTKLTKNDIKNITKLNLEELKLRLNEIKIEISWNEDVIDLITLEGYSTQYGARPIKRTIRYLIEDKISDLILSGEIQNKHIKLTEIEGEINFKII